MYKPKKKNDTHEPPSRSAFIVRWAITYAIFWPMLWFIVRYLKYRFSLIDTMAIGIPLATFLSAFDQQRVGERYFKHPMHGWITSSLAGAFVSVFAFNEVRLQPNAFLSYGLALLIPISLFQTLWLWRHVKSSWLWLLASPIGVLIFTLPLRDYDALWEPGVLAFFVLFLGLIHGALQAVVMHHLWTQPKQAEKPKPKISNQENSEPEFLQELEENDAVDPKAIRADLAHRR